MAKYIQIQVTTPCHEKWEDMQATADGSFCSSCQKTVIDFSMMSDEQLIRFFKKPIKNVCGKFYTDQLDQEYELPVKRIPWLKYFFQISIPALLLNYKVTAQHLLKKNRAIIEIVETKNLQHELIDPVTVNGCISNFEGMPVPYATIAVPGKNITTTADSNGLYTLHIERLEQFLEISAIGYEKKLLKVNGVRNDVKLAIATLENVVLVSEASRSIRCVTVGGVSRGVSVKRVWNTDQTVVPVLKSSTAVEVFPNPVKRNGQLTIHWKQAVIHDQEIIIYNAAGVKLLKKGIRTNKTLYQENINLDLHAAGYYIIHIIDTKTKGIEVVPFIVE